MDPVDVASSKENIGLLFKQKQEERRGQVPVSGAAAIHDQFVANFSDLTTRRERSQKDWQRNGKMVVDQTWMIAVIDGCGRWAWLVVGIDRRR